MPNPIVLTTPLGTDKFFVAGFRGQEGLSKLYNFQVDVVAENATEVAFDKILGQPATLSILLPNAKLRHFHGICNRISQGQRDSSFTSYSLEIVPKFWLLTKREQSRIFQQVSVPDILKKVLSGLDVVQEIQGTFLPRDYCVQYRETDFAFASRLMEEEGIYYFFKHEGGKDTLVLANTPQSHPAMPEASTLIFETIAGGNRPEDRVLTWAKSQELRSGKVTLWDHCFELPHKHLESSKTIAESVAVGKVNHKQKLAISDALELYDFPGAYAQRFDGVDPGGGDRAADIQNIFKDNSRTAELRMQEEAAGSFQIRGLSNLRQLVSGHKFTLTKHFNADGEYVVTHISHSAHVVDFRSSAGATLQYENSFTCIPFAVPFRPDRTTAKALMLGSQTAVVVGPPGEEIFTDKYGRVKVQFHWDREGKNNAQSSCWVRVASTWAGKGWGFVQIPRIGQEVVVDFLEGDPDQPIITGSVYNAENMPPYELPKNKTQSGVKSRSTLQGTPENFNEIRFEDLKGKEEIVVHAERNLTRMVENDESTQVLHNRTVVIGGSKNNSDPKKDGKHTETIEGDVAVTVQKGDYKFDVEKGKLDSHVKGPVAEVIEDTQTTTVTKGIKVESKTDAILLKASTEIKLEVGAATLLMKMDGTIELNGVRLKIAGTGDVAISGAMVKIN